MENSGVGKTRFVHRYIRNHFSNQLKLTVGVDFSLWDISGHEHFKNMSRVYFKGARGALVVYDIAEESTLEGALTWKFDLDCKVVTDSGRPIPSVLLTNKCDQDKACSKEPCLMDKLCSEKGFAGWFKVSAKENVNVDEAVNFLVKHILLCEESPPKEGRSGNITLKQTPEKKPSKCC
uniref:RAB32, member RAS onco family n=1 Tax=Pygocentrus nattereri TaxID=42514 RepID=A0A3B4DI80_PYGNA